MTNAKVSKSEINWDDVKDTENIIRASKLSKPIKISFLDNGNRKTIENDAGDSFSVFEFTIKIHSGNKKGENALLNVSSNRLMLAIKQAVQDEILTEKIFQLERIVDNFNKFNNTYELKPLKDK